MRKMLFFGGGILSGAVGALLARSLPFFDGDLRQQTACALVACGVGLMAYALGLEDGERAASRGSAS